MKTKCDILVVEDSLTQAELLKYLLEKNNYKVFHSINGKAALEFLNKNKVNIIISDIMMPEMDGYEFCRTVKDSDELKGNHVILLTALEEPLDIINGLRAGADNFIVKPYNEDSLINRIEYILTNESLRKSSKIDMGLDVYFGNKKHKITADRLQILDLLFSTYETVVDKGEKIGALNDELVEAQSQLKLLNEKLEIRIKERTVHLEEEIVVRKKAEEKLSELLEELKQSQTNLIQSEKLSSIGLLTAGIAHELNNPLMGILNYTQYALKHTQKKDSKYSVLEDAEKETNRCIDFVKNLLTFSHKASGKEEKFVMESCAALIYRVLKLLSFRTEKGGVTVKTEFAEDLPKIPMIPDQILQVFLNLVVNALDSLEESKKKTKEIIVRIEQSDSDLQIEVEDNGIGIPGEIQAKIFEPLFTTKPSGKGSGLGLTISQNIISAHKGQFTCESNAAKGAVFKLKLPLKKTIREESYV